MRFNILNLNDRKLNKPALQISLILVLDLRKADIEASPFRVYLSWTGQFFTICASTPRTMQIEWTQTSVRLQD